jgi:hypothetical protein
VQVEEEILQDFCFDSNVVVKTSFCSLAKKEPPDNEKTKVFQNMANGNSNSSIFENIFERNSQNFLDSRVPSLKVLCVNTIIRKCADMDPEVGKKIFIEF